MKQGSSEAYKVRLINLIAASCRNGRGAHASHRTQPVLTEKSEMKLGTSSVEGTCERHRERINGGLLCTSTEDPWALCTCGRYRDKAQQRQDNFEQHVYIHWFASERRAWEKRPSLAARTSIFATPYLLKATACGAELLRPMRPISTTEFKDCELRTMAMKLYQKLWGVGFKRAFIDCVEC